LLHCMLAKRIWLQHGSLFSTAQSVFAKRYLN